MGKEVPVAVLSLRHTQYLPVKRGCTFYLGGARVL